MASSPCTWLVLLTAIIFVLVLSCSAQQFYPSGRYGKRFETSPGRDTSSRFWSGSRYGRSNSNQNLAVVPRTDRFFLGSRYGKRGDWEALSNGGVKEMVTATLENDSQQQVTCLYTGITNLYRCYNRKDNSSEDTSSGQN
ncbi:RYamide neuropeptides [Anabrus simplex]|uniref:RYamide neuropeptides n=1 Tax=Anabrus simplex TaxID=316456 RepID=UPI0035A27295